MPAAPYPRTNVRYAFADQGEDLWVLGGVSNGAIHNDVNRYNATTNTWTPRAPIPGVPNAGEGPCGALWNGKIYVAQGTTGSALYIYDIATNTWTTGANRPVANGYGCAAGALNGKLYVAGGNAAPTTLSVYDIATNTWSTGAAPPSGIFLSGYQTVGNFLYVVGGFTPTVGVNSTATMRLDMTTGTWSSGPAFTPARADFGLASAGTKLYAIGGDANGGAFFDSTDLVNELDVAGLAGRNAGSASPPNLPQPVRQANQAGFNSTGRVGGEIWSTGGINGVTFQFLSDHLYRARPAGHHRHRRRQDRRHHLRRQGRHRHRRHHLEPG